MVAATPQRSARRAWLKKARWWAAGKSQLIDGVTGQLRDLFALGRHLAMTLGGLFDRLAAKVAACPCGQGPNARLGRPPGHLADLLMGTIALQTSWGGGTSRTGGVDVNRAVSRMPGFAAELLPSRNTCHLGGLKAALYAPEILYLVNY
jgi:hypothetical protein